MLEGKREIEKILYALAEQLEVLGVRLLELVVCGGAALNVLGYVSRTTRDIDIIAFVDKSEKGEIIITKASPLKPEIVIAAVRVKKDFNLPDNWLNSGPASVLDLGLPQGLMDRVESRPYGRNLIIHFLSRYDQIHFKLYAVIDQGMGKHYDDLMALNPNAEELESAARWCLTHDISEGFKEVLKDFLEKIGYKNVAEKL